MKTLLHFGVGNFFRAHGAETMAKAGWGVIGVSLRSGAVRDGLAAQGFRYTLAVMGHEVKHIAAIRDVLVAPENPAAVLDAIQRADAISATVTEKGYHLGADGRLDLKDPAILADLAGGPTTLIGYLARGLARRAEPVTVLSCDNQSGNGSTLRDAVHTFAKAAGLQVSKTHAFPNSMVDRITPATTDALRKDTGDPMAVATEPFREWVIEDTWAGNHPDWPDVQWVSDVAPHELRKLRMLNGAHSFLAYAGLGKGHAYVHQAIADPELRAQTHDLMAETARTLPAEINAETYAKALIQRFENPHLNHALIQIAMDGSQKMPYRIVEPLRELGEAPALQRALDAWTGFVLNAETLDDPKADALLAAKTPEQVLRVIGASAHASR